MILRKLREEEKVELEIQAKRKQVCPAEESLLKINRYAMADGRRIGLKEDYSVSYKLQNSRLAGKRILVVSQNLLNPFITLGVP